MSITGVCFPISVGDKDIVKSCSSSLTPALARAVVTCVYLYFYIGAGLARLGTSGRGRGDGNLNIEPGAIRLW